MIHGMYMRKAPMTRKRRLWDAVEGRHEQDRASQ